jgi:hypothetical protein
MYLAGDIDLNCYIKYIKELYIFDEEKLKKAVGDESDLSFESDVGPDSDI